MNPFRNILWIAGCFALSACGAAPPEQAPPEHNPAPAPSVNRVASAHDWTRFGWDAGRSSATVDPTGITAGNVATLRRQQVSLDGTVDGAAIYLHGVRANGGTHDVFSSRPHTGKRWPSTPPTAPFSGVSRRVDTIRGRGRARSRLRRRSQIPAVSSSTRRHQTGASRSWRSRTVAPFGALPSPGSQRARRSRRR